MLRVLVQGPGNELSLSSLFFPFSLHCKLSYKNANIFKKHLKVVVDQLTVVCSAQSPSSPST